MEEGSISTNKNLNELIRQFPNEWNQVRAEVIPLIENPDPEKLKNFASQATLTTSYWRQRIQKSQSHPNLTKEAKKRIIQSQMKSLALDQFYQTLLRSKIEGKKPLSFKNRWIANQLFFARGLERKPASLLLSKWLWPWMSQKGKFLSLVNEAGIYCFYSKALVRELAQQIGKTKCLELAAGDGTLTNFLIAQGVRVEATDDYSWSHKIKFTSSIQKIEAVRALKKYSPQTVICSWPPAGNSFEAEIFKTKSVNLYIVIGSQYSFATGNHEAYQNQKSFSMSHDLKLSNSVLPQELNNAVYVFRRL